jgi:DNA-binding NarL/FixJ family response regulator
MITRVLFIDSDAEALARVKEALEQAGDYEAKVFVTGKAALEYAAQNPPAVAVISLNVQDIASHILAKKLRKIRPGLPLLVRAPASADERLLQALKPQGVLYGSYTTRLLIPLVKEALNPQPAAPAPITDAADESFPDEEAPVTSPASLRQYLAATDLTDAAAFGEILESIKPGSDTAEEEDTFDVLVNSMRAQDHRPPLPQRQRLASWAVAADEEGPTGISPAEAKPDTTAQESVSPEDDVLFQKLAAEEPPMPTLDDSGTVRDLIAVTDFEEQSDSGIVEIPDEMIRDFSEVSEVTAMSLDEVEQDLLEALAAAQTAEGNAATPPLTDSQRLIPMPEEVRARLENGETPPMAPLEPEPAAPPPQQAPSPQAGSAEPLGAAALALQLTQHTLASSAQATLLVCDNQVIASAGALPDGDIAALADMIDYHAVLAEGVTKIKFVSLPESRLNFMAVAAPTVENMVLIMVFNENMHLRGIRQQAKTILEALLATMQEAAAMQAAAEDTFYETPAPDSSEQVLSVAAEPDESGQGVTGVVEYEGEEGVPLPAEAESAQDRGGDLHEAPESVPAIDPTTLVKYACAWILRDPEAELDGDIVDALPVWIEQIITAHHWLADQIDVQPDYISVVISIAPGEIPSHVIETLMTETAYRILAARPDLVPVDSRTDDADGGLWADAYYVIAPGRPLTHEELSSFISYQRQG